MRDHRNSLLLRVFVTNAALFVLAAFVLALSPATISSPLTPGEGVLLAVGLTAMLLIDLFLMRRTFGPLNRLRDLMGEVDPVRPGPRIPVEGLDAEIVDLTRAFNEMLDRLESERRESTARALAAQEGERRRVAYELHDEIGQSLTALLLLLEGIARHVPSRWRADVSEAQDAARSALEDLRRIVQRLRPEALDELGLVSALATLANRVAAQTGLRIVRDVERGLPRLHPDAELVIYRIAQESLTNVVRHAAASTVTLSLERISDVVRLSVTDDGRGLNGAAPADRSGIRGMRERALLVDATFAVERAESGGVEVRLDVPVSAGQRT